MSSIGLSGTMLVLTVGKAWIFRITHIKNVPWILENGLRCCNSSCHDPNFQAIGNPELIGKRTSRQVPIAPGGTLSDYVPFYFTPYSPMLLNIKTGHNGVRKTPMPDIAILISSLHKTNAEGAGFVFTDRHAYLQTANFSDDLEHLDRIDWPRLNARDFKRDPDDPAKFERYQAEALIHNVVPVSALLGIACHGDAQKEQLQGLVADLSLPINILARLSWYF